MSQDLKAKYKFTLRQDIKVIVNVSYFFSLQMDHGSLPDSNVPLSGRSQMIRERLHGEQTR